jgi:uncharacterized protein
MPVTPTYPGVYVQEVPSGVRTIAGVGTSTTVFLGRALTGRLATPVRCLNFTAFETEFSSRFADSDLSSAVRLFFDNGGTECWVVRLADNAVRSEVTLRSASGVDVLRARAKAHGALGDTIRLGVSYAGTNPEATFNLEVFRRVQTPGGAFGRADTETFTNLVMAPNRPRSAATFVTENSALVDLEALPTVPATAGGFSQSGAAVPSRTNAIFRTAWEGLIGAGPGPAVRNRFRISVDGGPFADVDLATIDFAAAPLNSATNIQANLGSAIAGRINPLLAPGSSVTVTFENGPDGQSGADNEDTSFLRISSPNGEVVVEPAASGDLAVPLMLGAAQGGYEVSGHAAFRPAPNGLVFDATDARLRSFGELAQDAFNAVVVDGREIAMVPSLVTTTSVANPRMFQVGDALAGEPDGLRGIAEKLARIADQVNAERATDPSFPWTAELFGSTRLALIPQAGGDDSQGTIATGNVGGGGVDTGGSFIANTRYYSLGAGGTGAFQASGVAGSDGTAPTLPTYRSAFQEIDRDIDLFNIMVLPRDHDHDDATWRSLLGPASVFCNERRAFLLIDPPPGWRTPDDAVAVSGGVASLRVGLAKQHSAVFFPRVRIRENGTEVTVGPSGAIAGVMARIDSTRGVWKAPAGTEADVRGVVGLERNVTDGENGILNPRAVNTLRAFPTGIVNWGARTMDGDDGSASEYKYIPVRRLALFIEESLYRGLAWTVFEPNDEPLWAQIRLNVGAFMQDLFRKGAFEGDTPAKAFFVKCDGETTTPTDRGLGVVNIWVGFAPLKPAEFVILYLQQMAGQAEA